MSSRAADPRSFKLMFIGITAFLIIAALYSSVLIMQRQTTLREVSRYDTTWSLTQAVLEVSRLEATVAAAAIPESSVDDDDVALWLDIVANRVELLSTGEIQGFLFKNPQLESIVADFRHAIRAAEPLLHSPDQQAAFQRIFDLFTPLNPKLMRLASAAYTQSGNMVARDLVQLSRLHWIFAGVLGGLIVCSFGLIATLTWHNRLLRQAHDSVQQLVIDLQKSGEELSAANQRAQAAIEEAQLQNRILKTRDAELHTQYARFDAALNNMSQALCMVDGNQRLIVCNARFLELFGLSVGVVQPGIPIVDVFRVIGAVGNYDQNLIEDINTEQQALVFAHRPGSFLLEASDGQALALAHQPMAGGGWVATYEDVTERRRAEARIRFMAHHDALTSLPNRLLFRDRMEAAIKDLRRRGDGLAVLCLDLDHFKNVNDTLGHQAGDLLLEKVAQRLRDCARDGDIVARLGGDEFAVLQLSAHEPSQAGMLAQRIVEVVSQPYEIDGQRAVVGVSVGIAIASREMSADALLKCADMALYRAKADGRGTHRFFEAEMDAQMQARREIELDLREALANQELEVFYQPVLDLRTGELRAFEALLRWNHPQRGMISPTQFIPIAEEIGLIIPLGEWVLQQACADAVTWPSHVRVAVNLSATQFRSENLLHAVTRALELAGLAADRLEIEITESALLQDNKAVLAVMHEFRALGIRTALDDFGTGYSSLSYLRSFPFDKLKIDQSFVREIVNSPDCFAIVASVAGLAAQLGITTTAEGVETTEQLNKLREAGCTEVQGYYFDQPQPLVATSRWFAVNDEDVKQAA
jgi:diguanylate cyclase (GGDEF)-like protein